MQLSSFNFNFQLLFKVLVIDPIRGLLRLFCVLCEVYFYAYFYLHNMQPFVGTAQNWELYTPTLGPIPTIQNRFSHELQ